MASLPTRILDWFRAIYPQGMSAQDYSEVLSVLSRRLTAGEIDEVAHELAKNGLVKADDAQIREAIRRAMLTPPRGADVDRVGNHLDLAQVIAEIENQYPDHG